MNLAVDVQYGSDSATVAGILFPDWPSDAVLRALTRTFQPIQPYEPGSFYKRELPCILALLEDIAEPLDAVVVDGFVTLGGEGAAGLGMHLFHALRESIAVVGVAKRPYAGTPAECEVFRGNSGAPLYVTAAGMALDDAKAHIRAMHGEHRIPTLLRRVDQLCRGIRA